VGRRRLKTAIIPLLFAALLGAASRVGASTTAANVRKPVDSQRSQARKSTIKQTHGPKPLHGGKSVIARARRPVSRDAERSRDAGDAPPLIVEAAGGGYNVTGRGFTLHLGRAGEITGLSCGGRPLFDEGYLEVRDATWHVKLSPQPEQVQSFPPHLERGEARFQYQSQISDTAAAIQLGIGELITIKAAGVIDVSLRLVPQAPFESQRISWNITFAADRFVDRAFSWKSAEDAVQTAQFPRQHAPVPQMAHNFDWMRLNDGGGPVDLRFSVKGANSQTLPVDNVLEDLRWWNQPRFWIADAAPYPRKDGDATKPMEVPVGVLRRLKVTMTLHPGDTETGIADAGKKQ